MKVAFLAGTLGRGGAERQLLFMLRALRDTGVEARVLCLTRGEAFEKPIRDLGIEVDHVGQSGNQLFRLGKIVQNLRSKPADIIQSAHFYTNIYAAVAGRFLGVPSIGAIRNDLTSELAANGRFGKWQLNLPKRLIANSQLAYDRALALGIQSDRIDLVRNVVETSTMRTPGNDGTVNVLFAGRLVEQKRPEIFVKLAHEMKVKFSDLELSFSIVGDGPLRSKLERMSEELGLKAPFLNFRGEVGDMSAVYEESDVLVLTSEHEGTPNVVLEAMSHGIPVVATRVGGVPEILTDECGFVVDPANFGEILESLSILCKNPDLRAKMGAKGAEYVGKNHSIKYLQERLNSVYRDRLGY